MDLYYANTWTRNHFVLHSTAQLKISLLEKVNVAVYAPEWIFVHLAMIVTLMQLAATSRHLTYVNVIKVTGATEGTAVT